MEAQPEGGRNSPLNKLVLTEEEQADLDDTKVNMRFSDAMYLRQHPELSLLINKFMQAVLEDSPADPLTFAQDFFTMKNLEKHILEIDEEDSSSSGEEDNLADVARQQEKRRTEVRQMLQANRRQRLRRQKKAKEDKACIDLNIDSSTDDDDGANDCGHNYGLSDARTSKLMDLFAITDRDGSGGIDSYEMHVFGKAFLSAVQDSELVQDAHKVLELIDVEGSGRLNKNEYLNFFSLVSGDMSEELFEQVHNELLDILNGVVQLDVDPDMVTGDKLVRLKMLFRGWDPAGAGHVPKDTVYLLAQAFYTAGLPIEVGDIVGLVKEVVPLEDFYKACIAMRLEHVSTDEFNKVMDPLLQQRYNH
eukprot:TRINITY_DN27125_c0_g1_i2.p1 TRINITY_DN27125_c0_g1~~TRINITY_DN27125_c0_g1_i2.p1  ORF type:complete len:362 (+),score=160.11 TRINITY_DN27125_c0_g1_i2:160-1245(+)